MNESPKAMTFERYSGKTHQGCPDVNPYAISYLKKDKGMSYQEAQRLATTIINNLKAQPNATCLSRDVAFLLGVSVYELNSNIMRRTNPTRTKVYGRVNLFDLHDIRTLFSIYSRKKYARHAYLKTLCSDKKAVALKQYIVSRLF